MKNFTVLFLKKTLKVANDIVFYNLLDILEWNWIARYTQSKIPNQCFEQYIQFVNVQWWLAFDDEMTFQVALLHFLLFFLTWLGKLKFNSFIYMKTRNITF